MLLYKMTVIRRTINDKATLSFNNQTGCILIIIISITSPYCHFANQQHCVWLKQTQTTTHVCNHQLKKLNWTISSWALIRDDFASEIGWFGGVTLTLRVPAITVNSTITGKAILSPIIARHFVGSAIIV